MPGVKFVSADPTPCYVKDVKVSDQSRLVVTFAIAGNRDSSVVIEMSPEDAKALALQLNHVASQIAAAGYCFAGDAVVRRDGSILVH